MPVRIFLILFILVLVLIYPSASPAAMERRTALVIGNSSYSSGPLKNPVNDATDMATALKKVGFSVTLKKNANHREMIESIEEFGNTLKKGGVGLFYYAGHGVQVGGVNYLLPIGARINKEGDVRYEAVNAGRVLTEMETANNGLNIVILDACRDNPFGKTFRSSSRGLAIVTNAPTGTFICYSTGAGQVARDGTGRNSPYAKALLENIAKPGLAINKVFMNVRSRVLKLTGQVPWELSSLVGDFYFIPPEGATASKQLAMAKPPAVETTPTNEQRVLFQDDFTNGLKWDTSNESVGIRNDMLVIGSNGRYDDWAEKNLSIDLLPDRFIVIEQRLKLKSGGLNYRLPYQEILFEDLSSLLITYLPNYPDREPHGQPYGWNFGGWTGNHNQAVPGSGYWTSSEADYWVVTRIELTPTGGKLYVKPDDQERGWLADEYYQVAIKNWSHSRIKKIRFIQPWDSTCYIKYIKIYSIGKID